MLSLTKRKQRYTKDEGAGESRSGYFPARTEYRQKQDSTEGERTKTEAYGRILQHSVKANMGVPIAPDSYARPVMTPATRWLWL